MYIGNPIYQVAFLTDQFSGNGGTTFTMSVAPANTASVLVAVSGVLQDPSTYSVSGTTLTFSSAPPVGTGNISARYLGIPASNVTTTAYRTVTSFTATASQTTFTPPSYTVGFINVYRNGVLLTPTSDYTASNGTTVVLASGAASGDTVIVESFLVSSVLNAIPNTAASVSPSNMTTGAVIQVVQNSLNITSNYFTTSNNAPTATGFSVSITPQFSTSKILVQVAANMSVTASSGTSTGAYATIYRGSTNLAGSQSDACLSNIYINANQIIAGPANMIILDSPATTSSTTYQVYCGVSGSSSNTMAFGTLPGYPAGATISIIAQEIR